MTRLQKGIKSKICVAVKTDDVSLRTIKLAEQYCLRTNSDMHLVTVCENAFTGTASLMVSSTVAPIFSDFFVTLQQSIQDIAESKMAELSKMMSPAIKVTTNIVVAGAHSPAELIEAEALSQNCSLVVVGANPQSHKFLPKGLSCALSLMSRAKLPVMVINQNHTADFGAHRLKLIITDDLKDQSIQAVSGGCDLAFKLGNIDIHHVHINGLTIDALEAGINAAMAASHSQPKPAVSAKDVYDATLKQLEGKLESRTLGLGVPLELSGCHYKRSIMTKDSVLEGLEQLAKDEKANLVAFGRHQTFHGGPFNLGQMPFYAMLKLECPIVIFPLDTKR